MLIDIKEDRNDRIKVYIFFFLYNHHDNESTVVLWILEWRG